MITPLLIPQIQLSMHTLKVTCNIQNSKGEVNPERGGGCMIERIKGTIMYYKWGWILEWDDG
jgi:hypothetical protein